MDNQVVVLRTAVDSEAGAQALAGRLVAARAAACAHVSTSWSTYRWKGRVEQATEWWVEAKARPEDQDLVWEMMLDGHPYDTPCVEVLGHAVVPARYAQWVSRATNRS